MAREVRAYEYRANRACSNNIKGCPFPLPGGVAMLALNQCVGTGATMSLGCQYASRQTLAVIGERCGHKRRHCTLHTTDCLKLLDFENTSCFQMLAGLHFTTTPPLCWLTLEALGPLNPATACTRCATLPQAVCAQKLHGDLCTVYATHLPRSCYKFARLRPIVHIFLGLTAGRNCN